jgi:hypothetical protein
MLHHFITSNRGELIKRCRAKVAKRPSRIPATDDHGVPQFLQQLADTLRLEQLTPDSSDPAPTPAATEIGRAAALHGAELLRSGYTVDQVIHDYGDVCQAVTELAAEQKAPIAIDEFHTLNRCLDNAIADAVTAFASGGKGAASDQTDELRRLADTAMQAYSAIKTGNIGLTGATGTLLMHALTALHFLADRSSSQARQTSGTTTLRAVSAPEPVPTVG